MCQCNTRTPDVMTLSLAECCVGELSLGLLNAGTCVVLSTSSLVLWQERRCVVIVVNGIEAPRISTSWRRRSLCRRGNNTRGRSLRVPHDLSHLVFIASTSSNNVIGEVGGTWPSPAEQIAQPAAGRWSATAWRPSLLCELLTWGPSSR